LNARIKTEARGYPLRAFNNRTLPDGYDGPVFVWDVDKTYLVTHFSSLRGLSRIPIEFAVDKRAIPGMPEVLRALRRGPGPGFACVPLYFVTGSPPLLRRVLEQKMLMDGVEQDGITFKDWLRTIREGRPRRLKEQVGYKVCALLHGRLSRPLAGEYLFGDDTEDDATAFTIYARILHGELSAGEVVATLAGAGVSSEDRKHVFSLLDRLPTRRGRVERCFIHLARKTPPASFQPFGQMVVPVRNAFQLALALYESGLVDQRAVPQSLGALYPARYEPWEELEVEVADARDRGLISDAKLADLKQLLPRV